MGYSPLSLDALIVIDDVSFSKEPCEHIPWKPGLGEKKMLVLGTKKEKISFRKVMIQPTLLITDYR